MQNRVLNTICHMTDSSNIYLLHMSKGMGTIELVSEMRLPGKFYFERR